MKNLQYFRGLLIENAPDVITESAYCSLGLHSQFMLNAEWRKMSSEAFVNG